MNLSIADLIELLISAAGRRLRLIVLPIVLFSALAVAAVLFWPRLYSTQALLMLQEGQSVDPLSLSGGASRQGRLKAEEIDMLLKSERVLAGSILDMNIGKKQLTAREIESEIISLRKRIGVSVVGNDFIEISFKQSEREGIGEKLSIVMTRFFERLLTREDTMKTAREFALEQRQRDVTAASSAIDDWILRAKETGAKSEYDGDKVAALRARLAELEEKLKASAAVLLPAAQNVATLDQMIAEELRFAASRSRDSSDPLAGLSQRMGALKELEAQFEKYRRLGMEKSEILVVSGRRMVDSLRSMNPGADEKRKQTIAALVAEFESLDARRSETIDQFDRHVARAKRGSGPSQTPFGLIAPDSIRIIDEPRDPALPSTSPLKILIACLGAGIGLGLGLAALAEQLDDRIYGPRGLDKAVGVDAVFRVPMIEVDQDAEVARAGESEPKRPQERFAVVSRA